MRDGEPQYGKPFSECRSIRVLVAVSEPRADLQRSTTLGLTSKGAEFVTGNVAVHLVSRLSRTCFGTERR